MVTVLFKRLTTVGRSSTPYIEGAVYEILQSIKQQRGGHLVSAVGGTSQFTVDLKSRSHY